MAKRKSFSINRSLSKGLEETITAAHDFSGELLVEAISIERLQLDPENPRELHLSFEDVRQGIAPDDNDFERKQAERDSLQTLAKSIKNQGLINPVVVYHHVKGYRLVAGERRTLASILAGKTSIQARILPEKPNELNRYILQWAENIEREDLSLWERISNIRSIVNAFATEQSKRFSRVTAAEISDLIGISASQSAQYKLVLQADDVLHSAIQANQVSNLDKAAFITKAPLQFQQTLITLCAQGATLKELKQAISDVTVHRSTELDREPAPFKVTIKNAKVATILLDSLFNDEKYIHLREEFDYDPALDGKQLIKLFNQVLRKIEDTVN